MNRILTAFVGVLLFVSATACDSSSKQMNAVGELEWTSLPSIPLGARNGHTTTWMEDQILVWGGGSVNGIGSPDGALFDPTTRSWSPTPQAPIPGRWFHSAVWTGTEVLIWGGRHPGLHDDGAAYHPASNTWRVISSSPLRGRSGHSAVWTGSEMIIFGGHISPDNNDYIGDAAAYNPTSDTWRVLPDSGLSDRMGAAAIWTGEEVVVWGGVNTNGWLNDGAVYSPATDSWRPIGESPLDPRQDASLRLDGDWVVFVGGIHNADTFEVPAAKYHLRNDSWAAIDNTQSSGSWPLLPGDHVGLPAAGTTFQIDGQPVAIPPLPAGLSDTTATYTGSALVILGGEAAQDTPGDFAFMVDLRE